MALNSGVAPLYTKVKRYIIERIHSGELKPQDRVPSENELVQLFGVSRMTVNRALRELTNEGMLMRMPGVGTFVADMHLQGHLIEINNIADEVRQRGHAYANRVLKNELVKAGKEVAEKVGVAQGDPVYHSVILHEEEGQPIQIEDRYVNGAIAPGYGDIDFSQRTPSEFLFEIAPLARAKHVVRAAMPSARIRKLLLMKEDEPCLVMERTTWAKEGIASFAVLYHPGDRFELSETFSP